MFDFDDDVLDQMETPGPVEEPVLVCFYSGGFFHNDGRKLMDHLLGCAAKKGIGESLILGFPDHYEFTGEGYEWWSKYVDRLVEEVDIEGYKNRPLIIFGHSRGCCPAMSLATRLGRQVLKVYLCGAGPIQAGQPTAWEELSKNFKKGGDKELLAWFSSLQPGNEILSRAAALPESEIPKALDESKWLKTMLGLMRMQYRDATYPQMVGDNADIQPIPAPILQYRLALDPVEKPEMFKTEFYATTAGAEVIDVQAGHMDCLLKECNMCELAANDMAKFVPAVSS